MWGGHTKDFKEKSGLASVHSFDPSLGSWTQNQCNGLPPPWLYSGACTSAGDHLYMYGGMDGPCHQSSLHQLNSKSWTWKQLSVYGAGPTEKSGCGMVTHGNKLVLFGGHNHGVWTNELHSFDLMEGESVIRVNK